MKIIDDNKLSVSICLSGGADGADSVWGMTAGLAGHKVIHWVFQSQKTNVPDDDIVVLSDSQLDLADNALIRANATLKRNYPPMSKYTKQLLQRNWYQVKDSTAVYAVSNLINGNVEGGTAWATQMFIDIHGANNDLPLWLFDMITNQWYQWQSGWTRVIDVPKPTDIWAGIGKRKLTKEGKDAIKTLMEYDKNRQ